MTDISHFGVKGMHWGVRKQSSSAGSTAGTSRAKKIAIGVGTAGLLVAGAAIAVIVLRNKGSVPVTSFASAVASTPKLKSNIDPNFNPTETLLKFRKSFNEGTSPEHQAARAGYEQYQKLKKQASVMNKKIIYDNAARTYVLID